MPGLPVRVQEEEPLVEGLGLDDTDLCVLPDACGLDVAGLARVPGPGLPVRVQGEGPAAGGGGGDGPRLSGQAGRGLLQEFRVRVLTVFPAGLVGVDLSLPVHRQQKVAVHADAGEPGVLVGIEDGGCRLSVVPGVDPLVGSERGLQPAACRGLQPAEPVGSLRGEGDLLGRALLRPGVDAPVAGQADCPLACGLDVDVVVLLRAGRADGQPGAGGGPVVRAQRPVRDPRPLGFQGRVLEDGRPEVVGLAVKRPPVEFESLALRILLRGGGQRPGLHS